MFVCGTVTALLLSDVLVLLADVIGLSTEYWTVVLASPVLVVGTVVWWLAIERRGSYSYLSGGLFGFLTALLTGLLWTVQFVRYWGVEMVEVPMVGLLISFVLGFVAVVGTLSGIPLLYARRRLARGSSP